MRETGQSSVLSLTEGKPEHVNTWQRQYTTEGQNYCRIPKTCTEWHETCCYCQRALWETDGIVCLSNHPLFPWPKMTQLIWHKPFAQRSSYPCAQMLLELCKWLQYLPKKKKKGKKNFAHFTVTVSPIYLMLLYPVNDDKCHSSDASWCRSKLCVNNITENLFQCGRPRHIRHMLFAFSCLPSGEIQQWLHQKWAVSYN